MARFVLVHGMFHGGWCWDRVARRLRSAGHQVVAPDLAGCGSDKTPVAQVSLRRWASDVSAMVAGKPQKSILVGHSRGGIVVSEVAEANAPDVAAVVYLTALMLPDGLSARDLPAMMAQEGYEGTFGVGFTRSADGRTMLPPENPLDVFYARCSPEDRAFAAPLIGPEPIAPVMSTVSVSAERWGSVPRIYIETTRDTIFPIEVQRAMIARGKPTEVHSMDADHMPIFNDVEGLVAILEGIASRYGAQAPKDAPPGFRAAGLSRAR